MSSRKRNTLKGVLRDGMTARKHRKNNVTPKAFPAFPKKPRKPKF